MRETQQCFEAFHIWKCEHNATTAVWCEYIFHSYSDFSSLFFDIVRFYIWQFVYLILMWKSFKLYSIAEVRLASF